MKMQWKIIIYITKNSTVLFQTGGRLKLTDKELQFKPSDKGKKGETIGKDDIELVNWQRLAGTWGVRIFTTDGKLHRFAGFKENVRLFFQLEFWNEN